MIVSRNARERSMCRKKDDITIDLYHIVINHNNFLSGMEENSNVFSDYIMFTGFIPFCYSMHFCINCSYYCLGIRTFIENISVISIHRKY